MRLHGDLSAAALDRPPAAAAVGPFPGRRFVSAWWAHRGHGELLVAETAISALPLVIDGRAVEIAGEQDLTDYHSPLGEPGGIEGLAAALPEALGSGSTLRFDSLPEEVAGPMAAGLRSAGVAVEVSRHEAAAVVELAESYEEHLASLRGKDRHEIRRKQRRFTEELGEPEIVEGPEGFDAFVEMHRAAAGRKGAFMDASMEGFFRELLGVEGAVVSLLLGAGRPVAGAFGFYGDGTYYLYNSGYDPEAASASPGVVLVDRLVAAAIESGMSRFDFLKGDERYKYRMGAVERPLYAVEATA